MSISSQCSKGGWTVSAGTVSQKENVKGERKEIEDDCCGNAGEIWRKVRGGVLQVSLERRDKRNVGIRERSFQELCD